jgi:hypothetical protein
MVFEHRHEYSSQCQHPQGDATPRRHRAGDRPPEGRASDDRNYLKGFKGDRANAVLAAAGYNFRLLLRWLALLLHALIQLALLTPFSPNSNLSAARNA